MHVAADAVPFTPDDQGNFGMRFEPNDPIDDMDPNLLKRLCPGDIRLFVSPRLQFHQGDHLLA